MTKIAASILTVDFVNLAKELQSFESASIDYIHFDVMDGIFVENISIGLPVLESIKKHTNIPIEVHLMIQDPSKYITRFAECGADIIGIHVECSNFCDVTETLKDIKKLGLKACITLKPSTDIDSLIPHLPFCDIVLVMSVEPGFGGQTFNYSAVDKLNRLVEIRNRYSFNFDIEIDGGINLETAKTAVSAGCNILVIGNSLINSPNKAEFVKKIKGY